MTRIAAAHAPGGEQPIGIAFSPDGRTLAVGYDDTTNVDLLDATTLGRSGTADTTGVANGNLAFVAWSIDGKRLFAGGGWDNNDGDPVREWTGDGKRIVGDHKAVDSTIMSLRSFLDGTLAVSAQDPKLALLSPDGRTLWSVEPQSADYRDQTDNLLVSADGARVQFGLKKFGALPAQFDLRARQLNLNSPSDSALQPARTEGIPIVWHNTTSPTLDGKALVIIKYEISRSLAIAPDGNSFILGSEWALRRFRRDGTQLWQVDVPGAAWAVNVTADGRLVVAAFGDGTIRWYRLSDGVELLAFFPHVDGKRWVAWTPLGQYVASPGGDELIQWQINHGQDQAPETFSAARFRDRFYRPDVVALVLDDLDPAKALAEADAAAGRATVTKTIEANTPPRAAILDPADEALVDKPDVAVAYSVEDRPGTAIHRLRLRFGDRDVAVQTNLTVPASGRLRGEIRARLEGDGNVLTLIAESDNGPSDAAIVKIHRPAEGDSIKPDLYVLAVGVRQFKNRPDLTLDYAGKDATDFVAQMRAQEGELYRHVFPRTLTETEATGDAILDGLEWLERQMTARDVAVVFLSTHGANDANGDFYLLPYDVDASDTLRMRRTSVNFNDVKKTLKNLAERGKTLVFLDACHSGNVLAGAKAGPPDVDKVAGDLASAESGVIVFSSSTGSQFSLQKAALQHGVFTYALLEAFKGSAAHEPPYLYVSDLDIWLRNEVKRLSNGAQTPQTSVPWERLTNPKIFTIHAS